MTGSGINVNDGDEYDHEDDDDDERAMRDANTTVDGSTFMYEKLIEIFFHVTTKSPSFYFMSGYRAYNLLHKLYLYF